MTEEYKEKLLNYITGNFETTTPEDKEIFLSEVSSYITLGDYLPSTIDNYYIKGIVKSNESTNEVYVMYGYYIYSNNTNYYGFLALLDREFNITKVYTQYDSGTILRGIFVLKQDEDNRFYGIDIQKEDSDSSIAQRRFIILNNFSVKDTSGNYKLKINASYNFPTNPNYVIPQIIFKNEGAYTWIGLNVINDGSSSGIKVGTLIINVGAENEWTDAYSSYNNNDYSLGGAIVEYNSSNERYIKIVASYNKKVYEIIKPFGSTTFTANIIYTPSGYTNIGFFAGWNLTSSVGFISSNNYYLSLKITTSNGSGFVIYHNNNGTFEEIYKRDNLKTFDSAYVKAHQGEIYFMYIDSSNYSGVRGDVYYQRYNGTINFKKLDTIDLMWTRLTDIFVGSDYNLLKVYIYYVYKTYNFGTLITEDYNPNNYNGEEYTGYNWFIPEKSRFFDGIGISFARNIYNLDIDNSSHTAIVQIPNGYLNENTIIENQLLGKDNNVLVQSFEELNKNIYEEVYLNYINTFRIIDEDTNKEYSADFINENILTGTQSSYTNTILDKWKSLDNSGTPIQNGIVNISGGTNNYYIDFIYEKINSGETKIVLYNESSSNEYIEIDISNLELNKEYLIQKSVKVE